jgi:short-subunit dehydrogenase
MSEESRVALVTGASAGIGLAVVEAFIARGMRVAMVARTAATLEREAARLGPLATPWPLDVGDLGALARLPGEVKGRHGRLDVVVNNAGTHHRGPVLQQTAEHLAEMVNVNFASPIVLCRAAAPELPEGGAIINVASLAGMVPLPGLATYSATKAGLRFFTRALSAELPHLRISTVSPGLVPTGFLSDIDNVSVMVFSQPMSTVEEVAAVVVRCLELPSTEIAIPWASGKLATFGYLFPFLYTALRPALERKGARAKAKYKASLPTRGPADR